MKPTVRGPWAAPGKAARCFWGRWKSAESRRIVTGALRDHNNPVADAIPSISVIATVLNEEASIGALVASLLLQTRLPNEIVLVDGGSSDRTVDVIGAAVASGAPIRLLVRAGANIAAGRNAAIAAATGEIIACTDAGVRLEPTWLEEIVQPFVGPHGGAVDVVSGFFRADSRTIFEVAMGATVLPDLNDVDPDGFLPSSRSIAFRKCCWAAIGGYPEWLDYCEDLVFDLALRESGCKFVFCPRALVHFRPRGSFGAFFRQYFLYGRGDGKAKLWTRRHVVRYAAYIVAPLAMLAGLWYQPIWAAVTVGTACYLYRPYRRLWPALTGRRWHERFLAVALVPAIKVIGDVAKMVGYLVGWRWRRDHVRRQVLDRMAAAQLANEHQAND